MENKTIFTQKFEEPIKGDSIEFLEKSIKVGSIELSYHHDQDCCEHVYIDLSNFKYHAQEFKNKNIHKLEIKAVPDIGLVFFFYISAYSLTERIGVLAPCYNSQNGYYSTDLELVIKEDIKTTKIELNSFGCVVDDID